MVAIVATTFGWRAASAAEALAVATTSAAERSPAPFLFQTTAATTAAPEARVRAAPAAGCSLARIRCVVPAAVAGGNYSIRGSEGAPAGGPCAPRSNSTSVYFDAPVDECNVSVAESAAKTVLTVVLVPGSLDADPPWPAVVCVCEVLTSGVVARSIEAGPSRRDELVSSAVVGFHPRLEIFTDASYSDAYSLGEAIPSTTERIYVEVTSDGADDVVGVPDCVAAPSDSVHDAHAQTLFTHYCDVDVFGITSEPGPTDGRTNAVRWSMRKFKFAGHPRVFLFCQVARCGSPPCGTCDGRRRLHEASGARQLSAETAGELAAESFELQPGKYRVLPADVPLEARTLVWGNPEAQHSMPVASTLRSNITMFGLPNISDAAHFVRAFEQATRKWTALEAHVNHVSVVFGPGSVPEATIVDLNLVAGDVVGLGELRLLQMMDNTDFATALLRNLGHHRYDPDDVTIGIKYTRPAAPKGPVTMLPPSAARPVPLAVILIAVAALVQLAALLALAAGLGFWRRLRRAEAARVRAEREAQKLEGSVDKIMERLQHAEEANQDLVDAIDKVMLGMERRTLPPLSTQRARI